MLEIKKYEAKTKEDALDNALKELKLTKEDLFLKSEFIEGKLFKSAKYIVSVLKKQDVIDFIADFIKNIAIKNQCSHFKTLLNALEANENKKRQ